MAALKVGDPFDEKTELGPMSTADGLADLDRDVKKTVEAGAKVLTGGKPLGSSWELLCSDGADEYPEGVAGAQRGALWPGG